MSMIHALSEQMPTLPVNDDEKLINVLLVVDQFPQTLGGGERIVLKLASLLPRYGYRASILTFAIHPDSSVRDSAPCPIYLLPLQRTYDLNAIRAAFALRRFIKQQRIQIVQTFFESSDIWAGFVTKFMSRAKLIWSRRDMGILRGRKHQIAYRLMRGMPDAVFAVSEQVRQYCIDVDRIDATRVLTIYNGLDLSEWKMRSRSGEVTNKLHVTTVGNIRRVKGHDIFIRAAGIVGAQYPDISFTIAGEVLEPTYFAELEDLVRDLKLSNRFHFVGGISDMRKYLADADVFVLPSRSEGFSNALIEAMAASLPIVATDVGGNSEAITDGVNGLLIPSEDVGALSEAIIRLVRDPAEARAMGDAGRASAVEKFTTEAMMGRIADVYKRVLSNTNPI